MTTKAQIVDSVATSTGLSKAAAGEVFDSVFAAISNSIANGERIELRGFGIFDVKPTKARQSRNPRTGEALTIPAGRKVSFKPAADLKARVNG